MNDTIVLKFTFNLKVWWKTTMLRSDLVHEEKLLSKFNSVSSQFFIQDKIHFFEVIKTGEIDKFVPINFPDLQNYSHPVLRIYCQKNNEFIGNSEPEIPEILGNALNLFTNKLIEGMKQIFVTKDEIDSEKEIEKLNDKVEALQEELKENSLKIQDLEKKLSEGAIQLQNFEAIFKEFTTKILIKQDNLGREQDELLNISTNQIELNNNSLINAPSIQEKQEKEIKILDDQYSALLNDHKTLQSLKSQIDTLQERLKMEQSNILEQENCIEILKNRHPQVMQELNTINFHINKKEIEISKEKENMEIPKVRERSIKEQIESINKELDTLENHVQAKNENIDETTKKFQQILEERNASDFYANSVFDDKVLYENQLQELLDQKEQKKKKKAHYKKN